MKTLTLSALIVLLAPLAAAQQIGTLLDEAAKVQPGNHAEWIAVRDQIVGMGEQALPALRDAGAEVNWTEQGWVRAMAADACRLRIENAQAAATVDNPPGLRPERYSMFRKPAPMCDRDFNHLPKGTVPLLLERYRWTMEKQDFSEGAAGQAEREALGTAIKERIKLRNTGIMGKSIRESEDGIRISDNRGRNDRHYNSLLVLHLEVHPG
jgi:hypothetical protein